MILEYLGPEGKEVLKKRWETCHKDTGVSLTELLLANWAPKLTKKVHIEYKLIFASEETEKQREGGERTLIFSRMPTNKYRRTTAESLGIQGSY